MFRPSVERGGGASIVAPERVESLRIALIKEGQIEAARSVIYTVGHELFAREGESYEAYRARLVEVGATYDVEALPDSFLAFWVLLDGEEVVGTCAVRALEETICELKRMYFLPRVRGLGWGRRMGQTALDWTKGAGFQTMWLDTDFQLVAARRLYKSLGFHEIPRYNSSPAELFFERRL